MNESHILVTVCLVVFVGCQLLLSVLAQEQGNLKCEINSNKCRFSWECCSGCCNNGLCDIRSKTCVQDKHPCATKKCQAGNSCRLVPVNCFTAPCPPVPQCSESSPSNSTCVMSSNRPECVPSCDKFGCPQGFECTLQLINGCTWSRCDLKPICTPLQS